MGIFKNITNFLKDAAPIIGSTIGFALGGPGGAAIGSGIASLAGGRDAKEALLNAGMAYGVGTFAKSAGFGKGIERLLPSKDGVSAFGLGTPSNTMFANDPASAIPTAVKSVKDTGIISKLMPESTLGKIALGGGIGALALGGLGEEEQIKSDPMRPYPVGKTRLGYGRIGDKLYNLDDEEDRKRYFEDNRNRGIFSIDPLARAAGGEIKGPGTGTSDSVPARLSDGEFVLTAKAVRGAGGGDRNIGAARMYDMMSQLEGAA
jgi:hypothetical protein